MNHKPVTIFVGTKNWVKNSDILCRISISAANGIMKDELILFPRNGDAEMEQQKMNGLRALPK